MVSINVMAAISSIANDNENLIIYAVLLNA